MLTEKTKEKRKGKAYLTRLYFLFYCLDRLLSYIPNVIKLNVRVYTDLQQISKYLSIKSFNPKQSNIRSLELSTINNIAFNLLESFFQNNFSRLEILKFTFKSDALTQSCLDYTNDKRWQVLLESLPLLKKFNISIKFPIESPFIANTFDCNRFFHEKNWRICCQIYTYSYNTILHMHTQPYPLKHLDIM